MNEENQDEWFRAIRTWDWEECETCDRPNTTHRLYQLEGDRNGATICFDCASEFGFVRGIDG